MNTTPSSASDHHQARRKNWADRPAEGPLGPLRDPLGSLRTPTRPCRTFHRDSPTKKARTKGLLKKVAIKSLNFFLGPSNEKEAAHVGKLKKSEGKSEKKNVFCFSTISRFSLRAKRAPP